MNKKQIREKLRLLLVGAIGSDEDTDCGDLVSQCGAEGLGRFMRAIRCEFGFEIDHISQKVWALDHYVNLDELAEFIRENQ